MRRPNSSISSSDEDCWHDRARLVARSSRSLRGDNASARPRFRQAVLDPHSFLEAMRPDFVLFALDEAAALAPLPIAARRDEAETALDREIEALAALWRRARERFGAVVLQQTVLNTRLPLFGSYDANVAGAPAALIDRFNRKLADAAADAGVLLVDIDRQAAWSGRAAWSDPVRWHQAK